ncbi:MAG: hypothetical protein U1E14_00340 [Geminicoccaceae bacterium]
MVEAARLQALLGPEDEDIGSVRRDQAATAAAEPDSLPTLHLADLLSDGNGEVVLFNDSGLRALAVAADAPVVAEGDAGRHVTASGDDVTGFHYLTFENGLTLYYQHGLEVIVRSETA